MSKNQFNPIPFVLIRFIGSVNWLMDIKHCTRCLSAFPQELRIDFHFWEMLSVISMGVLGFSVCWCPPLSETCLSSRSLLADCTYSCTTVKALSTTCKNPHRLRRWRRGAEVETKLSLWEHFLLFLVNIWVLLSRRSALFIQALYGNNHFLYFQRDFP